MGLALLFLRLIALSTNFFYYHRFSLVSISPAGSSLRALDGHRSGDRRTSGRTHGSLWHDKIRGHGIPEAMEAILSYTVRGSYRRSPYWNRPRPRLPFVQAVRSVTSVDVKMIF
jgi:hypothetical protein